MGRASRAVVSPVFFSTYFLCANIWSTRTKEESEFAVSGYLICYLLLLPVYSLGLLIML